MEYSRSYIAKLVFIFFGAIIAVASLIYSNYIAKELSDKERREISLWSHALRTEQLNLRDQIILELTAQSTDIPAIVVDEYMRIFSKQNILDSEIDSPAKLRHRLEEMTGGGRTPIPLQIDGRYLTVFYDESVLLKSLVLFPYFQLLVIAVLGGFILITYRSMKASEQNKVWVGMSKETAHQLGTPTSSLLGWVEYLRTQESMDQEIVTEMNKDVVRLMKVVDRFSKIGSSTLLVSLDVLELANSVVDYFQTRIPRNTRLTFSTESVDSMQVMANGALLEWVFENLLKNALDALKGQGSIDVTIRTTNKYVVIDVTDTGKGIAKANWKRIFSPGFTTKTRGWGLGLSLSRRIVESYHHGKIFVASSEIDHGTTMRVQLRKG
ncbi:MAG: HAMP domain-containing sensor histidine kinase [Rikenellaceae bacterium]